MKKIGVIIRETAEKDITKGLKDSGSFFVVRYSGLSSPDMTALRQVLRDTRSRMFVVKNTVARRALKGSGLEPVIKSIEGPCGLIFVQDEPVDASKALVTFAKAHDKLVLAAGFMQDKVLEKTEIEALAKLPSKDMLRAQTVGALKAPITGFVMVLNQTLKKFVYCLDQIKQKKSS